MDKTSEKEIFNAVVEMYLCDVKSTPEGDVIFGAKGGVLPRIAHACTLGSKSEAERIDWLKCRVREMMKEDPRAYVKMHESLFEEFRSRKKCLALAFKKAAANIKEKVSRSGIPLVEVSCGHFFVEKGSIYLKVKIRGSSERDMAFCEDGKWVEMAGAREVAHAGAVLSQESLAKQLAWQEGLDEPA